MCINYVSVRTKRSQERKEKLCRALDLKGGLVYIYFYPLIYNLLVFMQIYLLRIRLNESGFTEGKENRSTPDLEGRLVHLTNYLVML